MRVQVASATHARCAGRACELVDISVTGALVLLDVEFPVDSHHLFHFGKGRDMVELTARVVRVTESKGWPLRWQTALAFENVTPTLRRAISSTASRLLSSSRRSAAAAKA